MCDRCAALADEITYLRQRLGDRVNGDLLRVLQDKFGFTPSEARFVAVLYQARGVVPAFDIELAIKRDESVDYADASNIVYVFASRIRKRVGDTFIATYRGVGLALGPVARQKIIEAVQEDVRESVAPVPEPRGVGPWVRWDRTKRRQLHRLLRVEGQSYDEAASALKTTRGAVASAAKRFGYQSSTASGL